MATETMQIVTPPQEAIPVPESSAPHKLTGWDHIAFSVPDLVEAERWYVDVLGAEVVGRYNWGGDSAHPVRPHEDIRIGNHVISLFLGDPIGPSTVPYMFHYAFNCRSLGELEDWQAHLRSKDVAFRYGGVLVAHSGFGAVSLYFDDPWGCRLEIATWLPDFETAEAEVLKRGGVIVGADTTRAAR
jgi:catechol 2,3-dioxygenase-like lactoylglutathione lyase family enzyme